ncbi:hypothetical protein [Pseudomonas segetis]|uniref:PXPV repeat-containing protein n=1 Tax=Pseudomonas segetis TaxID=298908 RepID=A0A239BYI2_9PSED|nr:hypothetical protein [Pseudomonas segetis]SNS12722.1 hypothetical protein SAMN05216255_1399 [Pseudomonas segetis]
MIKLNILLGAGLLLGVLGTAHADQAGQQTIRVIPKTYISPGATGSIGQSRSSQQYNGYGGYQVPSDYGSVHQRNSSASQSFETRGGIRQSIVCPGGYEVERRPGSSTYERQDSR